MDEWIELMEHLKASWNVLGKPGRILAAISGGADSMALLIALLALSKETNASLFAVHVDHGLRSDSSMDAQMVQRFCEEKKIPCKVCRVTVNGSGENAAREARYEALFRVYRETQADVLALAHHRRDQAETVLMHLFRGSGAKGLSGMQDVGERPMPGGGTARLWRPFLDIDPKVFRNILSHEGIPWREDTTNQDDRYLRNFIRLQVLPVIGERIPEAEKNISQTAQILRDEDEYLRAAAQTFLDRYACLTPPCRWIKREMWRSEHPALQRRILRLASPVELSFEKTEEIVQGNVGSVINLPAGWRTEETARFLHFLPPDPEETPLDGLKRLPFRGVYGDGIRTQAAPEALMKLPFALRTRKPGDRIHPLGAKETKSLQDYLVDKKIEQPFRDHLPLLCLDNSVLWVIGVGVGEEMRVDETKKAVLLRYEGYLPGEK